MTIDSLVVRILVRMTRFKLETSPPSDLLLSRAIIGIYDSGESEERIVVTDSGVVVRVNGEWREVLFHEIVDVRAEADKERGEKVEMTLANGTSLQIHVSGHTGRFRDVYEVSRFLARAATNAKTRR